MSREGADATKQKPPLAAGTPIWVWLVYAVGLFATTIFIGSILFTVGGLYFSDEGEGFDWHASIVGIVLWSALIVGAAGLWVWRRLKK